MNNFGFYILILGLVLSIQSTLLFFIGEKLQNNKILISAKRSFYLVSLMVSIGAFALIYSFLTNDFSNIVSVLCFNSNSLLTARSVPS